MTNSTLTINAIKLAARWNIETVDLLYIMLNHGLNVVDHYDDEMTIGDVLEDFKKNKDASGNMFRLSDVKDIEAKLEVDGEIPYAETIRAKRQLEIQNGTYGFTSDFKINTNFIDYFKKLVEERKASKGNYGNWDSTLKHIVNFFYYFFITSYY